MKLSNKQYSDRADAKLSLRATAIGMAGCALTLLSACHSDSNTPAAAATQKQVVKHAPVPEDPTAKMARAVVMGKSNTPVDLKYDIANVPVAGQPIAIDFAMIPTTGADSMTLTFTGSPGLTLSADSAPPVEVVKGGAVSEFKLSAKADKENVYYITATATLYTAGTSSAKIFGIPIIVGNVAASADAVTSSAAAATTVKAPQNTPKKK